MTSIRSVVIVFVAVALLGVGNLAAEDESPVSVSFDTLFVNNDIWRGQSPNNYAVVQPGISIGYKGLTISSSSLFSHTGFGDSGVAGNHWIEHDFTMDYGFALNDKVSVNVGWINYAFPNFNDGRYSNEIYGAISVDTILQPSIGVYGDPHNVPTWGDHPDAEVPEEHYTIPLGEARIVQEGEACTVITWGAMVHVCEQGIRDSGVACDLIDLQTLVPWDRDAIVDSVNKTGRCVIVHEAPKTSGFGAEMAASVQERCFYSLEAPIERVTGWDTPFPHSTEWDYMPGPSRIAEAIQKTQEA